MKLLPLLTARLLAPLLPAALAFSAPTMPPSSAGVSYLGTSTVCPWTLPTVPADGPHTFTITDGPATLTRTGSINPQPRGRVLAVIAYTPVMTPCPTLVSVQ